jgi:4'-phosphopantetheinyl transferase
MLRLRSGEAHIWCVSEEGGPEPSTRAHASLSPYERSRAARFRFARDRQRFITAHGALRDILGRYLRARPEQVTYSYNAFGKPELGPEFAGRLRFSLSHAGGVALIAVAADVNIGVDVECLRMRSDYAEVARRFLSAAEVDELSALPGPLYAEAFLRFWTRMEAYVKARGEGLAEDLDGIAGDIIPTDRWTFHTLHPVPGYIGALAIEGGGWRFRQRRWRRWWALRDSNPQAGAKSESRGKTA